MMEVKVEKEETIERGRQRNCREERSDGGKLGEGEGGTKSRSERERDGGIDGGTLVGEVGVIDQWRDERRSARR